MFTIALFEGGVVSQWQGVKLANKRSRVRSPARARLRNDSRQVVYTHLSRCRPSLNWVPVCNNNNINTTCNNNHDNVYGAIIMTKVITRVHRVYLMNAD